MGHAEIEMGIQMQLSEILESWRGGEESEK